MDRMRGEMVVKVEGIEFDRWDKVDTEQLLDLIVEQLKFRGLKSGSFTFSLNIDYSERKDNSPIGNRINFGDAA